MDLSCNSCSKWLISRAGSLARLKLVSEELSWPGTGEARIAVRAVGLNFADIFACLGLYSATPEGAFTPGLEFAGVVTALGPGSAHAFQVGERVMGVARFGAYTTGINIDQNYLHALPEGWSFEQGAALPVQGLTAWYGLHELGNLSRNKVVLVQSAAGGVGLQAMEIIGKAGGRAVAVIGSPEKAAILKERAGIGDSQIVVRSSGFAAALQQVLDRMGVNGFDIVFDAVYGRYFKPAYKLLNPMGRYILYGAADMTPKGKRPNYLRLAPQYLLRSRLDPMSMISENKSLLGFNLIWLHENIDLLQRVLGELMASNPAPPFVGHEFDFQEAPKAMRFFQTGKSVGKIVLRVPE